MSNLQGENSQNFEGKSVLVCDDEHAIVRLMEVALGRKGVTVHGARDGAEALVMAREHNPDLILLDDSMPAMSGGEILKYLRSDPRTKDVKVAIMAEVEPDYESDETCRPDHCLMKPFVPDQVLKLL